MPRGPRHHDYAKVLKYAIRGKSDRTAGIQQRRMSVRMTQSRVRE